ncbi:N-acetyltransferase [Leptolyngbya sp. FACHB-261]|uniref:GNAT family N-acetyltransferase n=1 Tax=Leptolyngbya sp. FACHB-261 TaxID=2692806 RepID=UPI001686F5E2|nr:GNAT family N-acetyltransferase [Leptolyngbya sp. FACHB-261]MBD2102527.1 GNAT family N-acetyltransferase [Leptolyngbya sp. FACHB-261]
MSEVSTLSTSTIAQVLAESFADDPSFEMVFNQSSGRLSTIQAFFEPFVADARKRGKITLTPNLQGACLWYPADVDVFDAAFEQMLIGIVQIIAERVGEETAQFWQYLIEQVGKHEPQQSRCEVFFLGLKSSARGKGLGHDLIQPALDYADQHQLPCYLVSSNSRNLSFYKRHGFQEYCPIKITDTYSMTGMYRHPYQPSNQSISIIK